MNEVIIKRAKQIAISQGYLANSPAEIDSEGNINLCAASCIAKALIEKFNPSIETSFMDNLLSRDKDDYVPNIFHKYGLGKTYAKNTMMENDNLPKAERLNWFVSL